MKRKNRIPKSMIRMILIGFVLVSLLLMGMVVLEKSENIPIETLEWVVSEGETLWEIAEMYNPQGRDIRSFVSEIARCNHLQNKLVYPGQT